MVDKCVEKWIAEIVEQSGQHEDDVRKAIQTIVDSNPVFGERRAATQVAETLGVQLTDCAFLFNWWEKEGIYSIALPKDQVALAVIIKRPGEEPKTLPLEMSVVEKDAIFRTPGEWAEIWQGIEKQVLDELLHPEASQ